MYARNPEAAAGPAVQWVVVANAARARCFERDPANDALRELDSFVHPASRLKGPELGVDRGGLVQKGAMTTQYEPPTDPRTKEHEVFARELSRYLEQAALANRYGQLALIASNPFLGELKAQLGAAGARALVAGVAVDLTTYSGRELEQRVAKGVQAAAV